nr:hypothetical protein [uncultured Rhodopila sp.]
MRDSIDGAAGGGEFGEYAPIHPPDGVFFLGHAEELGQRALFILAGVVPGIDEVVGSSRVT